MTSMQGPWRAEVGRVDGSGEWLETLESSAFFTADEAYGELFVLSARMDRSKADGDPMRARVRRVGAG